MASDEIESPICCKDCYERGRADALAEIEQREREAFEAGRAGTRCEYDYYVFDDYLKQRENEAAK